MLEGTRIKKRLVKIWVGERKANLFKWCVRIICCPNIYMKMYILKYLSFSLCWPCCVNRKSIYWKRSVEKYLNRKFDTGMLEEEKRSYVSCFYCHQLLSLFFHCLIKVKELCSNLSVLLQLSCFLPFWMRFVDLLKR